MTIEEQIYSRLPYAKPFLFVDAFDRIDEQTVTGHCTYPADAGFYAGHFPDHPITPGVILVETMAQIGLVGLGIYLAEIRAGRPPAKFVFTSAEVDFLAPIWPGDRVRVVAEKIYFRLGKLKCRAELFAPDDRLACRGELAGMRVNYE